MMTDIFRPRTSRYRGGRSFVETKTNAWAAFIGFLLGRGYSSEVIAQRLADGTDDATVRRMANYWGLPTWGRKNDGFVTIAATTRMRSIWQSRAAAHGLSMEEYCRRLLICASMPSDLFDAIVDGEQFEDVQ